ncbi:MAG: hypothetical protein ABSF83_01465 [Nitrososphaerales archaeon]
MARSAALILLLSLGMLWTLSSAVVPVANAQSVASWNPTSNYPAVGGTEPISCSEYAGYVYCVGGSSHNSFYAPLSFSGIGTWKDLPQYPVISGDGGILGVSCVTASGYIYCVGGDTQGSGGTTSNATYYAPISSSGAGGWSATTPYPHPVADASCVASEGYIYCVGGYYAAVYYAPLTSSGIGPWTNTTSYPTVVSFQSCQASGGYVYCVGGSTGIAQSGYPVSTDAVYYAPLSSSGVGTWASTATYPLAVNGLSCAISGESYIYCVGGAESSQATVASVYYAPTSSSGVGAWASATPYPHAVAYDQACVILGNYVYCAENYSSGTGSYYAPVSTKAGTSTLIVLSQDANGTSIRGFYAALNVNGTTVSSGFTPYNFTLDDGRAYTVQVDDYGPCAFGHWADTGSTNASRSISIMGDTLLTAVYECNDKVASWKATTGLPYEAAQVGSTSCAMDSNYVYCVSGYLSYYARASSSGIGNWSSTTAYPRNPAVGPTGVTVSQTCLTSSGYIYCIGGQGEGSGALPSDAVVYAPVSSSGIAEWIGTTHYPTQGSVTSCVASGAYIYCIASSATYYAHILPQGGVGPWNQTATYPGSLQSCVASGGYIYCIGGNTTYYAASSPGGVGAWTATTRFPVQLYGAACAASPGSVLFCVGGYSSEVVSQDFVYYASVSPSGVGNWTVTASYPIGSPNPNYPIGCFVPDGYVYCVGYQPSYFSQISGPMSSLIVTSQDTDGETLSGLIAVLNQSGDFIAATGPTPASFNLTDGQAYTVAVDGNGTCRFDRWYDTGNTTAVRDLSVADNSAITAVFACAAATTTTSSSSSTSSQVTSTTSSTTGSGTATASSSMTSTSTTTSTTSPPTTSASSSVSSVSSSPTASSSSSTATASTASSLSSSSSQASSSALPGSYALLLGASGLVVLLSIGLSTRRRGGLPTGPG